MTWVKICGITNLEDALTAVEAGADAVGFVFYEKSPRNIDPETAHRIVAELPARVEKVGVFVNQEEDAISRIAEKVNLTAIQFHGDREDPQFADAIFERRPGLKTLVAISMNRANPEARATMWRHDAVHAFVMDSGTSATPGGTGRAFDWSGSIPTLDAVRRLGNLVLAGGLNPRNVAEAMGILKPWGVDVSSGVEAKPGKKDPEKVRAFVAAVRQADKGK